MARMQPQIPAPMRGPRGCTPAGDRGRRSTHQRRVVSKWGFLKRGSGKGIETSLGAPTLQKGSRRRVLQPRLVKEQSQAVLSPLPPDFVYVRLCFSAIILLSPINR